MIRGRSGFQSEEWHMFFKTRCVICFGHLPAGTLGSFQFDALGVFKQDIHRCSTPRFLEHGKGKSSVNVKKIDCLVGIQTNLIYKWNMEWNTIKSEL
ncbi:hypothetical protein AVEN_63225-1 [Araneus ventricosus]|uniref:Uncharacterized protein n=1 Tax=Araneus ventricosus TaxID=182803 RepID=A0A4Y2B190_ARAVE|nr:hypothetical protein AVEN_63225-1 [Araneus ventricosus]